MPDILRLIFDRRHVKDLRNWVLMILLIAFGIYHKFAIKPMQERMDRQGKRIHQIISVAHLSEKMAALEKSDHGNLP